MFVESHGYRSRFLFLFVQQGCQAIGDGYFIRGCNFWQRWVLLFLLWRVPWGKIYCNNQVVFINVKLATVVILLQVWLIYSCTVLCALLLPLRRVLISFWHVFDNFYCILCQMANQTVISVCQFQLFTGWDFWTSWVCEWWIWQFNISGLNSCHVLIG